MKQRTTVWIHQLIIIWKKILNTRTVTRKILHLFENSFSDYISLVERYAAIPLGLTCQPFKEGIAWSVPQLLSGFFNAG